jgi:NADPH:quinone reductase-like Zn-dependent oxidoreductase
MGFIVANEHLFGLEGAGVVTQVGKDVTHLKPGDRALMVRREGGCIANRCRSKHSLVFNMPDWMSFEVGEIRKPLCRSTGS